MNQDTKTIDEYSVQWTKYTHHKGYYGSDELFTDIIGPLLTPADIKDSKVADIGSGNGRTVEMLLGAEPSKVLAIEPSNAFQVLEEKYKTNDRVQLLNVTGDKLPTNDRRLTIYDQLNPHHARQEAIDLLKRNGFSDIKTHQRHGYSWSVLGTKSS